MWAGMPASAKTSASQPHPNVASNATSIARTRNAIAEFSDSRADLAALSVLLSLATVAAFAFALKGVGNEKLREIIQGTLLAVFALSGVGFLLWRIARFLESDNKRVTEDTPPDSKK